MSKLYNQSFTNEQNETTMYQLQEVERNGKKAYVLNEDHLNRGPGFDHEWTKQMVARDAAAGIQAKDGVRANNVELYQQRSDGQFDKVDFRYENAGSTQERWRETNREPMNRDRVERSVQSEINAPKETPQQYGERMEKEWKDLRGPKGWDHPNDPNNPNQDQQQGQGQKPSY